MANHSLSDNEILALTRKRSRQRKIVVVLCALVSGVIGAIAAIKISELHQTHQTISILSLWPIEIAGALAIAALLAALRLTRTPRDADSVRVLQSRIDELQWQYSRWFLIVVPTAVLYFAIRAEIETVSAVDHSVFFQSDSHISLFLFFGAFALILLSPLGVRRSARKVLNDELTRAMRSRALSLGYWILAPCMAAIYVLALFDQKLAIELMVPALFLAVAVPTLRFAYLDWRAGRNSGVAGRGET